MCTVSFCCLFVIAMPIVRSIIHRAVNTIALTVEKLTPTEHYQYSMERKSTKRRLNRL